MGLLQPAPKPHSRLTAVLAIASGILLILVGWLLADRERLLMLAGQDSGGIGLSASKADLQRIYREEISLLIDRNKERNEAAAERATKRIEENFDIYHSGVKAFTEDVTGWGTRFGMAGRGARDLWDKFWKKDKNTDAVQAYVLKKYETHIISSDKLQRDVDQAVRAFKADIDANRNRLYAELRLLLRTTSLPSAHSQAANTNLAASIDLRMNEMISGSTSDTLVVGIASSVGGLVVEEGMSFAVTALFTELATVTAASAATSGSAMGTSSAAGGSAGSGAGPVGTIVGVGAGLVVGAIVDWWLTDSFKEKLSVECDGFLDQLEDNLINGTPDSRGVSGLFEDTIRVTDLAQRQAIIEALTADLK